MASRAGRRGVAAALLVVVLAGAIGVWLLRRKSDGEKLTPRIAAPVKADSRVLADGTLLPVRYATLTSGASGLVQVVSMAAGQKVKRGEPLLVLSSEHQQASVDQAQAALHKAQSTPGATQADIDMARANLRQAKAYLAEATLAAPFDGTVAATFARVGEAVGAGTPVAKLGDLSSWTVETQNLTELAVPKVRVGAGASVKFDAVPGLKLPAKVTSVSEVGENRQGDIAYAVTLRLLATDSRLRWGMTTQVAIDPARTQPRAQAKAK